MAAGTTLSPAAASCSQAPCASTIVDGLQLTLPSGVQSCANSGAGVACGRSDALKPDQGVASTPDGTTPCAGAPAGAPASCTDTVLSPDKAKTKRLELTVSANTAMPGHTVLLTATAESPITGTGQAIEIFDTSTGVLAGSCSQGSQCAVAYAAKSGTHGFMAFVTPPTPKVPTSTSVMTSKPVTVSWIAVSVVTNHPLVGPGSSITLTTTSTVAIDKTGWLMQFYDVPTKARLSYCAGGNTCSLSLTRPSGGMSFLVAVLAPPSQSAPPAELVVAQTDVFTATWLSVSVNAITNSSQPGGVVHVVATVNADLTNSPWSIGIYDDHGQRVAPFCKTGRNCIADVKITERMPSFKAAVGSVTTAGMDVLGRLMQKIGPPPGKLANIVAESPLNVPTVHKTRLLWGVDSCKSFTSDPGAGSGLYPLVAANLGRPDFWGRYLTNTICPGISGAEIAAAHNTSMGILPIYNDYNCSNVVGYDTGRQYGAEAVAAAQRLGIPPGVALTIDIEPPGAACPGAVNVDGGFIQGWYDGVAPAGYVPAYYGNGSAGSEFANAYCAAVTARPEVANNSHLWTFQPSLWGGYSRGNAPGWLAYNTQCPEHGTAWQYMLSAGSDPDVDHDLLWSDFPLWYP